MLADRLIGKQINVAIGSTKRFIYIYMLDIVLLTITMTCNCCLLCNIGVAFLKWQIEECYDGNAHLMWTNHLWLNHSSFILKLLWEFCTFFIRAYYVVGIKILFSNWTFKCLGCVPYKSLSFYIKDTKYDFSICLHV